MFLPGLKKHFDSSAGFNMTPMIDVVFLLIIFFMVVCQFIIAENFEVLVPDQIQNSVTKKDNAEGTVTISVFQDADSKTVYAVGPNVISVDPDDVSKKITAYINTELLNNTNPDKIVNLRINENIEFSDYKHILKAVAKSNATDMQLAVFKEKQR